MSISCHRHVAQYGRNLDLRSSDRRAGHWRLRPTWRVLNDLIVQAVLENCKGARSYMATPFPSIHIETLYIELHIPNTLLTCLNAISLQFPSLFHPNYKNAIPPSIHANPYTIKILNTTSHSSNYSPSSSHHSVPTPHLWPAQSVSASSSLFPNHPH